MTSLEDAINQYALYPLKNFTIHYNNINERDKTILNTFRKDYSFNNIRDIITSYKNVLEYIRFYSFKVDKMVVNIKKTDQADSLLSTVNILYKGIYLSPINNFYYLKNPNSASVKCNLVTLNSFNRDFNNEQTKLLHNETSVGFDFKYNQLKKIAFIQNTSSFRNNVDLTFKSAISRGYKNLNRRETCFSNKIYLTKNLIPRPFLFKDFPEYDKIKSISLVYGHKVQNNYIDYNSSSNLLIAGTPSQDSITQLGLVYNYYSISPSDKYFQTTSQVLSSNLNTLTNFKSYIKVISSLNSNYISSKFFYRRFFNLYDSFIWQMNIEGKNNLPILGTKLLKSHETISVEDFKGVANPGPRLENGDSIGMLNVFKFYNKLYFTSLPLFNAVNLREDGHQFLPFIHFNLLYDYGTKQEKFVRRSTILQESNINLDHSETPRKNTDETIEKPKEKGNQGIYSNLYLSGGFGLSYFNEYISIEAYYNTYIKRNKADFASEFGFSIGSD